MAFSVFSIFMFIISIIFVPISLIFLWFSLEHWLSHVDEQSYMIYLIYLIHFELILDPWSLILDPWSLILDPWSGDPWSSFSRKTFFSPIATMWHFSLDPRFHRVTYKNCANQCKQTKWQQRSGKNRSAMRTCVAYEAIGSLIWFECMTNFGQYIHVK